MSESPWMDIDRKRLTRAVKKARAAGLKYNEVSRVFGVAPSVVYKWVNGQGRCHKDRGPQFEAFYAWTDAGCEGIAIWRENDYAVEHNPAKIALVHVMGQVPAGYAKPKRKYTKKTQSEALTTVVDSLELDLEEFLISEQKLRAQHALEFAARKAGIALPKATHFAVLLVAGLQSGGVLHTKDFSSLLK